MQPRYSQHATERMTEQGITRAMVEAVLASPATSIEGATANEYEAAVGGRPMHVVLASDPESPIVITVYWVAA